MAATTISAILERFESVLQSEPLNLTLSTTPFSDEVVPNTLVNEVCRVQSGGVVSSRSTSNYQALRMDRVSVSIQRALQFEAYQTQRDIQDILDDIERYVIADGPEHGYMVTVEKGSRKIVRRKDADVVDASIHFLVDYDFDEGT
jgi:hypothetical protein